jgi:methionyl aminopeptidase
VIATTDDELKNLRTAGRILAEILRDLSAMAKPGISSAALDLAAEEMIRARGAVPAFLNYRPRGAAYAFPAALCVSINDEVVHGIPTEQKILKAGDLVMLDCGLSYNGFFSDAAVTLCVGKCDEKAERLVAAVREGLRAAVAAARVGNRLGDIGAAVEAVAKKYDYAVAEDLGGHGIGRVPHEKPYIANTGVPGKGEKLVEGMVLALEPIFTEGSGEIVLAEDEWTYRTADHSRSAEFEHTVLITAKGAEILTA